MAGGAGSVGGSGGMGQQPMGNASAQPGGGVPSYAQPYLSNLGMGNASAQPYNPTGGAPQQSTNQSTMSQGLNTMFGGGSPFGMQQQQPYGMQPMQNPFAGQNPYINSMPGPSWAGGYLGQQQMGRQQDSRSMGYEVGEQMGQLGAPNQMAQPMPQQPQQPSYQSNPDFQAYQTQMNDLSRQMDDYVKKAPMYQQLQDLQGKMRGFQQPQGQMGDTGFNRAMPAVMPQQPDPGMAAAFDDSFMGRPPRPDVAQGTIGIGNFEQDQLDRAFGRPPRMGGYGPRGGYGGRMGGYGQPQPGMGLQALSSLMQGRRGGFGGQQPQTMQQAPQGMEMRRGMGGSYYVPAGTPYDPAMD